ncbi:MAG: hypothetical protein HZB92_05290 [Euryarchaeota archaeon]|nr:hypothetical protein [Euryarchaeota archaeon]
MFVKEVRVSFGRTVNLGNFESTRVEMTECAVVTDNNADEVAEALYEELRRKVEMKCEVLKDRRAEAYRASEGHGGRGEDRGRPPIVDGKRPGNAAS